MGEPVSNKALRRQIRQLYSDREVLVTRLAEYRRVRNHVDAYLADSPRKARMMDDLESMACVITDDIIRIDETIVHIRKDPRLADYRERIVQNVHPSGVGFKAL